MKPAYVHHASRGMVMIDGPGDHWLVHGDQRWVSSVRVPAESRRQGIATSLMRKLCLDADSEGIILMLYPEVDGASEGHLPQPQLEQWYHRFGFTWVEVPLPRPLKGLPPTVRVMQRLPLAPPAA